MKQECRRRVGIMGGTFDPIHIGHLILAECAYEQFELDTVLFLPSGNPPHKQERTNGAADHERLAMVSLAIRDNPHFTLDTEEMDRAGCTAVCELSGKACGLPSRHPHDSCVPGHSNFDPWGYTYTDDTLRMLREKHPDTDYYFIIGADSLMAFDTWKNPAGICQNCILLAAVRDQLAISEMEQKMRELKQKYGARVHLLHSPNVDISSSDLRSRYREGRSIRYYVPDNVLEYIKKEGVYSD